MTWSLNRTGHLRLADGSVLRLDAECGRYVASYYAPGPDHLVLRAYMYGDFDAMKAQVDLWAAAFEASTSLAAGVGNSSAPVGIPGVEQPLGGVA